MTIKEIQKSLCDNRKQIEESASCGCLSCGGTFPSVDVDKYDKDTAICPVCSYPTVLGDSTGYPAGEPSAIADLRGLLHEPSK